MEKDSGGTDEVLGGDGEPTESGEPENVYTIDELAGITGVPSRTIRFYQSKGTLPSPRRQGRVALYGQEHVDRLKLIAELQDRGLRLDAIRDVLSELEWGGDSLQNWLGVGERLQAPWNDERPLVLTTSELKKRFQASRPGLLADLERAGMIRREGNSLPASYIVPSPGLLDIGVRLEKAGIDVDTAIGASELMREALRGLSDELVSYFADRAGKGFGLGGRPDEVVVAYDAIRPMGVDALRIIFAQEIERSLREFVESGRAVIAARPRSTKGSSSRSSSLHSSSPSRRSSSNKSSSSSRSKSKPRSKH
jgi:DNA-binding transcriptional MerR regulator